MQINQSMQAADCWRRLWSKYVIRDQGTSKTTRTEKSANFILLHALDWLCFSAVCLLIVVHGSKCVWHGHRYTTKCGYQPAGCPTTSSLCLVGRSVALVPSLAICRQLTWLTSIIYTIYTSVMRVYSLYICVCTLIMNSVLLGFQHLWTQREGMTMDRHWRRQMPMRSSQPKVGVFFLCLELGKPSKPLQR